MKKVFRPGHTERERVREFAALRAMLLIGVAIPGARIRGCVRGIVDLFCNPQQICTIMTTILCCQGFFNGGWADA